MTTASQAFDRLFKAIAEYHQSTRPTVEQLEQDLDRARRDVLAGRATPNEARAAFRRHPNGDGFTIDGSLRPGQPTRPGDQNSGEFIGLRSGHAIAEIRKVKDRIDRAMNDLLVETKPGFDDSITGINAAWDVVQAVFAETLGDRDAD